MRANKLSNNKQFVKLRKDFPEFTYDKYSIEFDNQEIRFWFDFNISGKYFFKPSYIIPIQEDLHAESLSQEYINTLVFHIGLVEMISYWKASCSPLLIVRAGSLTNDQKDFLLKLFYNGLGEFRYLNNIFVSKKEFLKINCDMEDHPGLFGVETQDKYLVPVGGGKDSAVSLELLKGMGKDVVPFALNPDPAIYETIINAGYSKESSVVIRRKLDPLLLELNDNGFLNGHTPFSALLAFVSLFAASLSRCKWIALSNESSASEPTVPGTNINHQYSKSLEFENDFRKYVKQFITLDIQYFSLLRPLNELQIAALFSGFESHFDSFRSCNVGSKQNEWCGSCPKCLFVYIIMSPFISDDIMQGIFKKNLLDDESLKEFLNELTGISDVKPFECIGTIDEVNAALCRIIGVDSNDDLPCLIKYFKGLDLCREEKTAAFSDMLKNISDGHNVGKKILEYMKNKLKEI